MKNQRTQLKMKQALLMFFLLLMSIMSGAQDHMYIHFDDGTVQKVTVSEVDSIIFYDATKLNGTSVKGFAQKGPFINGSAVTIYDLYADFSQSGKSFTTQIKDNNGSFELSRLSLSSNLVSMRADGFYFNEVLGKQSYSQITLFVLSDISEKNNININLLTHLEKARVEFLIDQDYSFSEAKAKAQKEVLAIFNISRDSIQASECLNIAQTGEENGILLAVSAILQGYRTESELTELLSNISEDIRTDGILSNLNLGSDLLNHAVFLDTTAIRNNLIDRYDAMGVQTSIPDFGSYITQFISQTSFTVSKSLIDYPAMGITGSSILSLGDTVYSQSANSWLSMAAIIRDGLSLKVRITSIPDSTYALVNDSSSEPHYENTLTYHGWVMSLNSIINWHITTFGQTNHTQLFTAIESGKSCNLSIRFPEGGKYLIEYFEKNNNVATKRKIIKIQLVQ